MLLPFGFRFQFQLGPFLFITRQHRFDLIPLRRCEINEAADLLHGEFNLNFLSFLRVRNVSLRDPIPGLEIAQQNDSLIAEAAAHLAVKHPQQDDQHGLDD